jgi:hypothetical protein
MTSRYHPGPHPAAETARQSAEPEAERGYLEQLAALDDVTAPRARYILEEQQAILADTPFNRGRIRATAEYICTLESVAGTGPDPEPEAEIG